MQLTFKCKDNQLLFMFVTFEVIISWLFKQLYILKDRRTFKFGAILLQNLSRTWLLMILKLIYQVCRLNEYTLYSRPNMQYHFLFKRCQTKSYNIFQKNFINVQKLPGNATLSYWEIEYKVLWMVILEESVGVIYKLKTPYHSEYDYALRFLLTPAPQFLNGF